VEIAFKDRHDETRIYIANPETINIIHYGECLNIMVGSKTIKTIQYDSVIESFEKYCIAVDGLQKNNNFIKL
jgi:hypothetical protein